MFSIFVIERRANGRYVKIPAASWRMKPARSNSWWLATCASDGASRKVCPKSCVIRIIPSQNSWPMTGIRLSAFSDQPNGSRKQSFYSALRLTADS
jgi:hypothetical protein